MLYRYRGPMTAITFADGRDVILTPGAIVDLPDDADVTATLVALGRLTPEAAPRKSAKTDTTAKE